MLFFPVFLTIKVSICIKGKYFNFFSVMYNKLLIELDLKPNDDIILTNDAITVLV